eukprot:gnl/TRDRNA2_/TRDRNA2_183366_c0_seq1.p1 gnl/TRDRNA2_/TRDRNA2_183366_c0~~gnl/TRDRNA2_/TRDRNA2_183366_c0_seq1.p1  ORF type:complete len:463 (+),score=91.62 gnl/TRDRNA2_/TRDRNA2_183366_c0_seq1:74-1462(+)
MLRMSLLRAISAASVAAVVIGSEYDSSGVAKHAHNVDPTDPFTAVPSVEDILEKYVPETERKEVFRMLHGKGSKPLPIPATVQEVADKENFQVKLEGMTQNALKEQNPFGDRSPRVVRIAAIQNAVPIQPDKGTLKEQFEAIVARVETLIDAAGGMGVNICLLQEAWTAPFFFATREKYPYIELAEDPRNGVSTQFIKRKAKQWNMVIVSPILERDPVHSERIWNTAVVIGNTGNYIGKHRKNHIPRVGDFNEATYYTEGDTGHPVFETAFGKIAINICYGRHHPLNWMMFGLNGAEIVMNPSATVGALSEPMWPIEARAASIFFNYFSVVNNRIGTETYPNAFTSGDGKAAHKAFGHFYGSSYIAAPDAARTPSLSRLRDGVIAAEVDLNQVRQMKDIWMLAITGRYDLYAKKLADYVRPDFKPQVIRDPALEDRGEPGSPQSEPVSSWQKEPLQLPRGDL